MSQSKILFYFHPICLVILLFVLAPSISSAQSKGYMGKKLIIKTTAVNGIRLGFNSADLEYVTGRQSSIDLFFENINYSRGSTGVKRYTGSVKPRSGYGDYREFSTLKNGTTKGWLVGLGVKKYFNAIVPAPYGFYTSVFVGFSSLSFENFGVDYTYKAKSTNADSEKILAKASVDSLSGKAMVFTAELPSIGYQRIIKRFVVIDARISALTQYSALPENLVNAMEHNYYVRSNTVSYGIGNFSIGLSAYIKIGILLF